MDESSTSSKSRTVRAAARATLWDITRGCRLTYCLAIVAMGLSNVFTFGVPLVTKAAIDGLVDSPASAGEGDAGTRGAIDELLASLFASGEPASRLWLATVTVVGLTAAAGVLLYFRGRWNATSSEAIIRRLRDRLYEHLEHLPCAYHDRTDTGDLVQRCTSDVETIRVFLSTQIVEIGRAILLLLTVLPIMLWMSVPMTLISLTLFPIILFFAILFFKRIKALFLEMDEAEGRMTTVLQENLTGIRVVRAFGRQDFECEKFAEKNAGFRDRHARLIRLLGVYWAISDFLCLSQLGIVLVGGAAWLLGGQITIGTFYAFMTYEWLVVWPVRHMGRVLADSGKATVALGRVREVLAEPRETEPRACELSASDPNGPRVIPRSLSGAIEVENLRFAFDDGERAAIVDLNFELEAGGTLALLGHPGSGKSTLIHLLLRLYDYEHGSIRLDGEELASLDRKFVRSQVGVVLQEPFLYSKTIRENLQVGKSSASREEIVGSAVTACVHDSIEEFDERYDTMVGERGVTLSGGQRQRVSLARALLKDPPILILDDALSAVDTETEARILAALKSRRGRRTTIIIAHRLSATVHADHILVLDHGRVVQSGTHEELVRSEGLYRRLWAMQGALSEVG